MENQKSDLDSDTNRQPVTHDELLEMIRQKRDQQGITLQPDDARLAEKLAAVTRSYSREEVEHEVTIRTETDEQKKVRAELSKRSYTMSSLLREAGGNRFRSCSFKTYEATLPLQKKVLEGCMEYANTIRERSEAGESLLLFGPVGTGKDHLAFAVCWQSIMKHGFSASWINGQDWFGRIRDLMDEDKCETTVINPYIRDDLLVISDPLPPFGSLTTFQSSMLYRLVGARYAEKKATIFTVNVATDAEADERIGAAIWDRMNDKAWKMFCNWPSARKPSREIK